MTDGESVRFSSAVYALPARTSTGTFTVTVTFATDTASGMGTNVYAADATLQGSTAALATTTVRGIVSKTDTTLVVALTNTSAISSNTLWLNVLVLPTT